MDGDKMSGRRRRWTAQTSASPGDSERRVAKYS